MNRDPFPLDAESLRAVWWGELGHGKTAGAVRQTVRFHNLYPDLPVFSNTPLFKIPFEPINSPDFFFDEHPACCMLLDELWHLANSRQSMSLLNDIMTMLLIRSRKKRWRVFYTMQYWTQIDLRIRFITDRFCEPEIRHGFVLYEAVQLKTGVPVGVPQKSDIEEVFPYYDHTADPFTLDIAGLKARWVDYKRKHGMV